MGAGLVLAARRKDGSEFPAEISLAAITLDGSMIVSAAVRDVTERLKADAEREELRLEAERQRFEARLQQSRRLESLGQLAGGVAHDFNNLLAAILNYASFVREAVATAEAGPDRLDWESVVADVDQIARAAERAAELTRQLLAFGRREMARPVPLDLGAVARNVESMLQRTIGEHIELSVRADPCWSVQADPGQIEQVLMNLAVNARDAMPDGGALSIEVENIAVDADYVGARPGLEPGRYVRLRVSDTGTGMDADVVRSAFEPFFTTKPVGVGSGLGLATVHGIVAQAGGMAQIYSEPGLGTTFTALFPATDKRPDGDIAVDRAPEPKGHETILVADDEPAIREVARRVLERNGYTVLVAASGAHAVELAGARTGPIHLVLTDVVMPKMLGQELAEKIRALCPSVRVLYMSGYAQPVLAHQGTLDPAVLLLEKPFSQSQLLGAVRDALDGHAG